jgi:shikimate 5-dehydrogenase
LPNSRARPWRTNAAWCRSTALRCAARLCPAGGRGCNITVPFKLEAAQAASVRSERVQLAGAANTLSFIDGAIHADNTDGLGLVADIEQGAGFALAGRDVLLVGAGGAAAGALGPLLAAGPRRVVVANRTLERAQALVQSHAALAALQKTELSRSPHKRWSMILISSSTPPPAAWPAPKYPCPRACCAPAAWPTT